MASENKSQFWMFAFIIFIFFILMKHTIQTKRSNAVTRIMCPQPVYSTTCAQGIPVPVSVPSQNLIPIPATPPTPAPSSCLCCGTPVIILRILSAYKATGTVKPTCALTLCFYNKYLAEAPNATTCQKKVFAIIANESANNFTSNAPINVASILQTFTGVAGRV